jgi:hypothetical protein
MRNVWMDWVGFRCCREGTGKHHALRRARLGAVILVAAISGSTTGETLTTPFSASLSGGTNSTGDPILCGMLWEDAADDGSAGSALNAIIALADVSDAQVITGGTTVFGTTVSNDPGSGYDLD